MHNILAVYERLIPTVSAFEIAFHNFFDGYEDYFFSILQAQKVTAEDIEKADTIIFIRPNNYLSKRLAQKAKRRGATVISFMDDDLFALPKSEPRMSWRKRQLRKVLALSDVLLSSSKRIAENRSMYTEGKRGVTIDTVVSQSELAGCPEQCGNDKVRIVYAAGRNHEELFRKFVEPFLKDIDAEVGENVTLDFVGVHPQLDTSAYTMSIRYHDSLPLLEYRQLMKESRFDIGLAPLESDAFSACKYFNKYIEYTLVGVTGIYSNVEPYTFVINDGVNGMLADNVPEIWRDKLLQLIRDSDLRCGCYNRAKQHLANDFTVENIRGKLLSDIPEMKEMRTQKAKVFAMPMARLGYDCFRILDTCYLILFYLKHGGVKKLCKKIYAHFKTKA